MGLFLTIIFLAFGLLVPWALALAFRLRARGAEVFVGTMGWQPMVHSMLAYALAFNLTFFIQELFLVLPKAMVPDLTATLFHNNHDWTGTAPIAELFQGTGALAILASDGEETSRVAGDWAGPSPSKTRSSAVTPPLPPRALDVLRRHRTLTSCPAVLVLHGTDLPCLGLGALAD